MRSCRDVEFSKVALVRCGGGVYHEPDMMPIQSFSGNKTLKTRATMKQYMHIKILRGMSRLYTIYGYERTSSFMHARICVVSRQVQRASLNST